MDRIDLFLSRGSVDVSDRCARRHRADERILIAFHLKVLFHHSSIMILKFCRLTTLVDLRASFIGLQEFSSLIYHVLILVVNMLSVA